MKKNVLLYLLCILTTSSLFSANYYWRTGSGTWNDPNKWSLTNGGGAAGSIPSNTDDVFFTTLSGLAVGNNTITFPTSATSTCRNLTFATGVALNIRGATSARLDVNGSVTLEPNMNFGTGLANTAALAWLGSWYLYQSASAATFTLVTANNTFHNELIRFEIPSAGTGGDFQINGNFNMIQNNTSKNLNINLQNTAHNIYFNNNANLPAVFILTRGTVYAYQGYNQTYALNANNNTQIRAGGVLRSYGNVTSSLINISGRVFFNAGNTATGNTINCAALEEINESGPFVLDFNNCDVNIGTRFNFGGQSNSSYTTNITINTTNSTLRFLTTASSMLHSSHTFNNIIVENTVGGTGFFTFQVFGPNQTHTPTIDSLTINKNVLFNFNTSSGASNLRTSSYFITGLLKLEPGISCDGIINRNQFNLISGATLEMQGTCEKPIFLTNTTHSLSGVGTTTVDNLIMEQIVRALPGASYPSGAGSYAVTGANIIGWTFTARTPRTLVWTGGCNLPLVNTAPTLPVNTSTVTNTGLTFSLTSPSTFNSAEVYATNTGTAAVNMIFRVIISASGGVASSVTVAIPAGASNLLVPLNFNVSLNAVAHRVVLVNSNTRVSFRFNTAASFPIDIIATNTGCDVGNVTNGLLNSASSTTNYYTFYNLKFTENNNTTFNWYNDQNWCDVTSNPTWSLNPLISPPNAGYCGSVCPPTEIDSVIFPNNSFVFCDKPTMYCEGMNWLGSGSLTGNTNQDMEVWGSLHLSPQMTNNFGGTFRFRSNRNYLCHITTSNKPFKYGVVFNSEDGIGKWELQDTLKAPILDGECVFNTTSDASFLIVSGHLHTGNANCIIGNGKTIVAYGMNQSGGTLSLYDSDVFVNGYAVASASPNNGYNFNFSGGVTNSGTSHIIFQNQQTNSTFGGTSSRYPKAILGNKTYYEVTCRKPTLNFPNNYSHIVSFGSAFIHKLNLEANTWPIIQCASTVTPGRIQKINSQTSNPVSYGLGYTSIGSGSGTTSIPYLVGATYLLEVDSLMQNVQNTNHIGIQLTINSIMNMTGGSVINFGAGINCNVREAHSYTSPFLPTCPGGGTVNYAGATLLLNGNCTSGNTTINGGNFIANSTLPINLSNLTINNNTVTGPNAPFNAATSLLSGSTTGWNGVSAFARKLHWVDVSSLANNVGNFQNGNNWEQIYPTYLPAPQCPPTQIDTVLFDNTSFSANNQQVQLTGLTDMASMYWENITAGTTPQLVGAAGQNLTIRASLRFHANMVNNQLGVVLFRGITNINFPQFFIRSANKNFNNDIQFNADNDNTEWYLMDNLNQSNINSVLYLNRGKLYCNGNDLSIGRFYSTGSLQRLFDIANSVVTLKYSGSSSSTTLDPDWNITGTPVVNGQITSFQFNAKNSKLFCTLSNRDEFVLGGHKYDSIISNSTAFNNVFPTGFSRDSINVFRALGSGASNIHIDSVWIGKAELFKPFNINSAGGKYDSLIFRNSANIFTSNKIRKNIRFDPGRTYNLTANTVQWFSNLASVDLDGGTAGSVIQFYGVPTGSVAYIRKDSAYVCANFVNIRDVWAIGNGNNPVSCTSYTTSGVNTICSYTATNRWIQSRCDTITDIASTCGSWNIAPSDLTRGRADFNGGIDADLQGGNVFGWAKRGYPPIPQLTLTATAYSVCPGEPIILSFSGISSPPFLISVNENGTNIVSAITSVAQLATYNPTTYAFTYTTSVNPTVNTSYGLNQIIIDRCFNSISSTAGGTVSAHVYPTPSAISSTFTPSALLCQSASFTINTSASSGTTYTLYPAPTGTSGAMPMSSYAAGTGTNGSLALNASGTYTTGTSSTTTYTLYSEVTSNRGCPSPRVPITFTVEPSPQITTANTDNLCSGNGLGIALNSNIPATYSWIATSNTVVVGESTTTQVSSNITDVLSIPDGSASQTVLYTIIPTSTSNGCNGAVHQITVAVNASPTITASYAPAIINPGDSFTVSASGASTYSWEPNGLTVPAFTTTNNIVYTVTATNAFGCETQRVVDASTIGFLPIELIDFTANCENNYIKINWKTLTELNNDYFELKRSDNGIDFTTIAKVQGAGTTNMQQTYQYIDSKPFADYTYYRLIQTDFDLTKSISKIIAISCTSNQTNSAIIFPNPTDNNNLNIVSNIANDELVTIKVIDILGQVVLNEPITLLKNKTTNTIKINNLAAGTYLLQINSKQLTNNYIKFIKQ